MAKLFRSGSLLIFFSVSVVSMELLLRIATNTGGFFSVGTAISVFFALTLAFLLYIASSLFTPKFNFTISWVLMGLTSFAFASQVVYNGVFKTFYSLYSAGNSLQALEFWRDILDAIAVKAGWVGLLFLPTLLIVFRGKKFFSYNQLSWPSRAILICCILLTHGFGLAVVHAGDQGYSSAYTLYYQVSFPLQSVEKLGLVTTVRLDMQRLLLGWTPPVEPLPPLPIWSPSYGEYNIMDIDFETLIAQEDDQLLNEMHRYFASQGGDAKNDYTGKYQGYNLIMITAEGFSHLAIREDITPTLYKMQQQGYNFTDFYTPLWGVSTTDGEYVACTGIIPKVGVWSFFQSGENYLPFVMGNQLNRLGYKTVAYHNHTYTYYRRHISHPNLGYDYKAIGNGLVIQDQWPRSDLEMMEVSIPEYIGGQPFHAYYMTVSGHLQYNFEDNDMASKNRAYVQGLPYSQPVQAYLATQIELDRALEHLLEELEKAGVADNTLIALSADHYPFGLEDDQLDELAGYEVEKNFEKFRNSFLLYAKGMEPITIDEPSSSLDIIPTLSNLLGLEYDSRLLMGRDIHSQASPLVIFANRSFITDIGRFNAVTGEFNSSSGAGIDEDYVDDTYTMVARKIYYSAKVLDTDYFLRVVPR